MSVKESWINETGLFPKELLKSLRNLLKVKRARGKLFTLSLDIKHTTRSILQNRYYFGVIVKGLAEEIGYEPEIMHELLKRMFLKVERYPMPDGNDVEVVQSTKTLNTVEFEEFLRQIREWAKDFLNCFLPLPNESPFDYTKYEV